MNGGLDTNPLFTDISAPGSQSNSSRAGDLMDAINRQASQLDSFGNNLAYVAMIPLSVTWNGTGSGFQLFDNSIQHNLGYAPIPLAYYQVQGETRTYPCNDDRFDGSGNLTFSFLAWTTSVEAHCQLQVAPSAPTGTPLTANFMIYLLKDPAQTVSV